MMNGDGFPQVNPDIDELTGLYNRTAFYRLVREMIRKNPEESYNLIISDIESFKMINVRYGEEKGDELLAYVGRCLSMPVLKNIVFARYSGDQFVAFAPQMKQADQLDAELIMESMQNMYRNAPVSRFEVKFGVYDNVDKTLPISRMCDRALMALRTIKHQYGKMIATYDQRMHQQYIKEQQIQEYMETALKEKQFQVYYQPKHDSQTGKLVGAEALARWIHPIYGFMSPAEFIPIFEKNGFISHLDYYVWKNVYQNQKKWINQGLPVVPISVNISRKDILRDGFIQQINKLFEQEKIDPSLFHMEITETVFIEDVEYLQPIIKEIQDKGIRIELDDFGSGFSALSLLSSLPLDVIKLDIGFVRNLDKQQMIIENIIKICHGLNCVMVAEGVENEEQMNKLRGMNCDIIQGFYFSKPLPSEGFEEYMRNWGR